MPGEQPLLGERLVEFLRGVEHHFDDAFDIAAGLGQAGDIESEPAGDRRADLVGVQAFPPRSRTISRHRSVQDGEAGFGAQVEPQRLHFAEQPPLLVAHGRQAARRGYRRPR